MSDNAARGHSITAGPWTTLDYWWDDLGLLHRGYESVICARVMSFMAGRMAEEEILGFCNGGDGDDREQIDVMLDSLLPADANLAIYAQRLERKLRPIIRRHRAAIERVAAERCNDGTLSGQRIEALYQVHELVPSP